MSDPVDGTRNLTDPHGEKVRRRRPLKVEQRCREQGPGKPRSEPAGPWRMALWDGQMRWVRPVYPWHLSRYWFAFDASRYEVRPIEWDIGPVTWHTPTTGREGRSS